MWIGVLWTGLRVAMWIAHVGGNYRRHGLLEKSLNQASAQRCQGAVSYHTRCMEFDSQAEDIKVAISVACVCSVMSHLFFVLEA